MDVRWGRVANGPSRTDTLTDKPLGAGRRPGKNLQGRVHKRILHSALDREEVAPRTPQRRKNDGGGVVANAPTRGRAEIGSLENETHLVLLSIDSDAHGRLRVR